ncbi:hypothetical protein CsSME_00035910 [Camellia sinensis var. sinensis]
MERAGRARNGGWIPVVSQWKGGRGQRKEPVHGLFTVFVDHIPSSMDAKSVYKLFTKFGIVKDVFIPFKRRKMSNSRFGFVRFDCSVAADVAIQKAHGLLVEDQILEVKNATYDRRNREEHSWSKTQYIRKPQPINRDFATNRSKGQVLPGGHRSFTDILKGVPPLQAGKAITTIEVNEEGHGWLYDSAIIRFKAEYSAHIILKALKDKGLEQIIVRRGGGRDVILTFNSQKELHSHIGHIKEWFKDLSQFVVEWKPGFYLEPERCVWLRCYSIHLNV